MDAPRFPMAIKYTDFRAIGTEVVNPPRKKESRFVLVMRATGRLILPVAALAATLFLAYAYRTAPVTIFDGRFPPEQAYLQPGNWLTVGHALLPLAFFVVSLTNRRYGPNYAVAQIVAAWAVVAGLIAFALFYLKVEPAAGAFPDIRTVMAFTLAILIAQLVSAVVFDGTRGVRWWSAPLFSGLWAGIVFTALFYPVAFVGVEEPWINRMSVHLGIMTVAAFLLLIPYFLLRAAIKPLPGFAGR